MCPCVFGNCSANGNCTCNQGYRGPTCSGMKDNNAKVEGGKIFIKLILILLIEIDLCTINNGGCSPLVNCTHLLNGTIQCDPCPQGYVGDGTVCEGIQLILYLVLFTKI